MLQQTQARRAVEPYRRFVARFSTPQACASAGAAEVVRAWHGLGYNRRALHLHQSAVQICRHHGGAVPDDLESLLALPGIGPYTARAVLAFAFGEPVGVVDTNVARVLARAVGGRPLGRAEAQRVADGLVPPRRAWEWNQALFDLGALHCRAGRPLCAGCPVEGSCTWAGRGLGPPDPAVGSAGTSRRQSPFAGSDRQGRGRLIAELRRSELPRAAVPSAAGWPDDPQRAERVVSGLIADGLARWEGEELTLA